METVTEIVSGVLGSAYFWVTIIILVLGYRVYRRVYRAVRKRR